DYIIIIIIPLSGGFKKKLVKVGRTMEYQQLAPPPPPPPPAVSQVVPAAILHVQQQQQQQQQQGPQSHPHIVVPTQQQQGHMPPVGHGAHQIHAPLPSIHEDSASSRWSQYQHLWRQHHVYMN
ncbi:hypothetical protein QAD02_008986, partial [Eretmocerus hayati]